MSDFGLNLLLQYSHSTRAYSTKASKDLTLYLLMSYLVIFYLVMMSPRARGGWGQGRRCLGGLRFYSFYHFFSQALMWKARLLVPNLIVERYTIDRRCSKLGRLAYSL
jgi:hypothetical protein